MNPTKIDEILEQSNNQPEPGSISNVWKENCKYKNLSLYLRLISVQNIQTLKYIYKIGSHQKQINHTNPITKENQKHTGNYRPQTSLKTETSEMLKHRTHTLKRKYHEIPYFQETKQREEKIKKQKKKLITKKQNFIQLNNTQNAEETWKESIFTQVIPLAKTILSDTMPNQLPSTNNNKIILTTKLNNLLITYEKCTTTFSPKTEPFHINEAIHQHLILMALNCPNDYRPPWYKEHSVIIKMITRVLEIFRDKQPKGRRKCFRWKSYDNAHNLGLLLILAHKGINLTPNKAVGNITKILKYSESRIWLEEPPKTAVIYYAFSTKTKAEYVGQSTMFKIRKHRETWEAKVYQSTQEQKVKYKKKTSKLQRIMAATDYRSWYHWPIRILGSDIETKTILENEKQIIQWIRPSANAIRRHKRLNPTWTLNNDAPTHKSKKNKCIHHKRTHKLCQICTNNPDEPTLYTVKVISGKNKQISGPSLNSLLENFKTNDTLEITKQNLKYDLTNYHTLNKRYGRSLIYYTNNNTIKNLCHNIATAKSLSILIKLKDQNELIKKTDAQIITLCNSGRKWSKQLKHSSIEGIVDLWTRINLIKDIHTKEKGKRKIRTAIAEKINIINLPYNNLTIPYLLHTSKNSLEQAATLLIQALGPPSIKNHLAQDVKVIFKNRKSIAGLLTNNRNIQLDMEIPPKCLGTPYCNGNNHYSQKLHKRNKYTKILEDINANMIPEPSTNTVKDDIYKMLANVAKATLFLNIHIELEDSTGNSKAKEIPPSKKYSLAQHIPIWTTRNKKAYYPTYFINYKRTAHLWKLFCNVNLKQEKDLLLSFTKHLSQINKNQINETRKTWMLPLHLLKTISQSLKCTHERFTSALTKHLEFPQYNSIFESDKQLNTLGPALSMQWINNGFAYPPHYDTILIKTILHAIASLLMHETNTAILLPIYKNTDKAKNATHRSQYNSLLKHPYILPIIHWKENALQLSSNNYERRLKSLKNQNVLFWVAKHFPDSSTLRKIKRMMKDHHNPCPKIYMEKTPITQSATTRNTTLLEEYLKKFRLLPVEPKLQKTSIPPELNISKYDLMNTLNNARQDTRNLMSHLEKIVEKLEPKKLHPRSITDNDIKKIKDTTPKGAIIMIHDKNPGELTEECPLRYYYRMKKEIYDKARTLKHNDLKTDTDKKPYVFEEINSTKKELTLKLRLIYEINGLNLLAKWQTGEIPKAYCNVKDKDNNKSRLISASNRCPGRKLLQLTGKALSFLLKNLPTYITHFTLHTLKFLKENIHEISRKLKNCYKPDTNLIVIQSDVEEMFTNLDHHEIKKAIKWLCNFYHNRIKSKIYTTRSSYQNCIYIQKHQPYECTWQKRTSKEWIALTLDDIVNITTYDLDNSYTSTGLNIFKQIRGAPIGGFLSTNYANIKCALDEWNFCKRMRKHPELKTISFGALRQVDDLMAWAAYKPTKPETKILAEKLLKDLTSPQTYTGGLSLKIQEPISADSTKQKNKFTGSIVNTTIKKSPNITITPLNKNWNHIVENGIRKYKIYPMWQSYIPHHIKSGFIYGMILRIIRSSTKTKAAEEAALRFLFELHHIGYPKRVITRTLKSHIKRLTITNDKNKQYLKTLANILQQYVNNQNLKPTNLVIR